MTVEKEQTAVCKSICHVTEGSKTLVPHQAWKWPHCELRLSVTLSSNQAAIWYNLACGQHGLARVSTSLTLGDLYQMLEEKTSRSCSCQSLKSSLETCILTWKRKDWLYSCIKEPYFYSQAGRHVLTNESRYLALVPPLQVSFPRVVNWELALAEPRSRVGWAEPATLSVHQTHDEDCSYPYASRKQRHKCTCIGVLVCSCPAMSFRGS